MQFPDLDELGSFPVINDFAVTLRDSGEGGQHVFFTGGGGAEIADFPAWDHADRDLRHFIPSDVPYGTYDEPYDDADDAWRIRIFGHGDYVYVMQGDRPNTDDFGTFFRVPRDRYLAAWAFVVDAFNPITPLDES